SLRTGFFAFWKSLKAIGNYRLSPIPVLTLYDVQSSQTVQVFLLLSFCLCAFLRLSNECALSTLSGEIIHKASISA
ncbi:hypothetical protein, partial [Vibrio cholerae]|uniref:hypothetical protein n=1 Tax=Vibrio cholerae TaxID=666 RepID=UPI001C8EA98E